jgi:predicted ABC-type ATPase
VAWAFYPVGKKVSQRLVAPIYPTFEAPTANVRQQRGAGEIRRDLLQVDAAIIPKKDHSMTPPKIIIIAGPNGAGKTTFAQEFLPQEAGCPVFVNADLIAAGLSPFAPERAALQAGRLTLAAIAQHVAKRESFAFETALSGKAYATQIPAWRQLGYRVELFFLSLPTADIAVARVAQRVRQGGHDIPEATIRRRFEAGKRLFTEVYQPLVDQWVLYDNAGDEPQLISWSDKP